MIVSEARLAANRANGARSHGPTTPEGKAASRGNALKHGLSGAGVVTSEVESAEIGRRAEALTAQLKPVSAAGLILIERMAVLSVRIERAAAHESAATACRVRHAADDFDEDRIGQAEALFDGLAEDPRKNLRKLRKSPEGVIRMIEGWADLKADLSLRPRPHWTPTQVERAGHLLGLPARHAPGSRIGVLSKGFWGDFSDLGPDDGAGLDVEARKDWCKSALFEQIDAAIAGLEDHYLTLDFETIELDRAESGARALFDSSKAATLARRYEAEAQRNFFKALKEFRLVEAEARAVAAASKTRPTRRNPPRKWVRFGK